MCLRILWGSNYIHGENFERPFEHADFVLAKVKEYADVMCLNHENEEDETH